MYPLNTNRATAPRGMFPDARSRKPARFTRLRVLHQDVPLRERDHIHIRPWSWMLAAALAGALMPGLAAAQARDDAQDAARPWTASSDGHPDQGNDSRNAADTADSSSPWDVTLGVGAAARPTYEGSDEYAVIPVPWVDITYNDWLSLGVEGLSAYWRSGNLRIGGGVTQFDGRDDSDSTDIFTRGDDRLKGMGDLDSSLAVRVFASYQWGMVNIGGSVAQAIDSSGNDKMKAEGTRANLGVSIPFKVTDKLTLTAALGATWADEKYTQAFFGVTPEQAKRSGFAPFKAESGLKSVDAAFGASYQFSKHWSIMTLLHGEKLTGDAADSPIVFSDTNTTIITTVNYHF